LPILVSEQTRFGLLAAASQESNWSGKMAKKRIGQEFREFCLWILFLSKQ